MIFDFVPVDMFPFAKKSIYIKIKNNIMDFKSKLKSEAHEKVRAEGGVPKEKTLAETLGDTRGRELFGKFITSTERRIGDTEAQAEYEKLAEKIAKGKDVSSTDLEKAREIYKEFQEVIKAAEHVKGNITKEMWETVIHHSPGLKDIVTTFANPDQVKEIVEKKMFDLAVSDPEKFKTIKNEIDNLNDWERKSDRETEKLRGLAEQSGVPEEVLDDILQITNQPERRARIEEACKKACKWTRLLPWTKEHERFEKLKVTITGSRTGAGTGIEGALKNTTNLKAELESVSKELGESMAVALTDSEEFRQGLVDVMRGVKVEGAGEKRGARRESLAQFMKKLPDANTIEQKWNAYRQNRRDWSTLDAEAQEAAREQFLNDLATQMGGDSGEPWDKVRRGMINEVITEISDREVAQKASQEAAARERMRQRTEGYLSRLATDLESRLASQGVDVNNFSLEELYSKIEGIETGETESGELKTSLELALLGLKPEIAEKILSTVPLDVAWADEIRTDVNDLRESFLESTAEELKTATGKIREAMGVIFDVDLAPKREEEEPEPDDAEEDEAEPAPAPTRPPKRTGQNKNKNKPPKRPSRSGKNKNKSKKTAPASGSSVPPTI